MHTYHYRATHPDESDVFFHHDSDLSGPVHIVIDDPASPITFEIPGQALVEFIASYVQTERITTLEQMNPKEILGLTAS